MANITSSQVLLKQAIQTMLTSEKVSGRMQMVKAVARSRENQLGEAYYPYVGISILKRSEQTNASRMRQFEIDWAITVMARSTSSLEAATDALDTVLDDGQGNGVEVVLRDPANYNLGGICISSEIKEVQFFDSLMMDASQSPTSFTVIAVIMYSTLHRTNA